VEKLSSWNQDKRERTRARADVRADRVFSTDEVTMLQPLLRMDRISSLYLHKQDDFLMFYFYPGFDWVLIRKRLQKQTLLWLVVGPVL
jgi:hypothetical protein